MTRIKNIRTSYNLEQNDIDNNFEIGEYYDLETQPSLTDPSQAMEVKDLLNMFSRGGTVRVLRAQNWGEDIPQEFSAIGTRIHTMDKTEKAQASLDLQNMVNIKSESIDATAKKKAQKIMQAAADKAAAKKAQKPTGDE